LSKEKKTARPKEPHLGRDIRLGEKENVNHNSAAYMRKDAEKRGGPGVRVGLTVQKRSKRLKAAIVSGKREEKSGTLYQCCKVRAFQGEERLRLRRKWSMKRVQQPHSSSCKKKVEGQG